MYETYYVTAHKAPCRAASFSQNGKMISNWDFKEQERWCPGRQKWQPEVDIFSLLVLRLNKFIQWDLNQRYSDLLCETEVLRRSGTLDVKEMH